MVDEYARADGGEEAETPDHIVFWQENSEDKGCGGERKERAGQGEQDEMV